VRLSAASPGLGPAQFPDGCQGLPGQVVAGADHGDQLRHLFVQQRPILLGFRHHVPQRADRLMGLLLPLGVHVQHGAVLLQQRLQSPQPRIQLVVHSHPRLSSRPLVSAAIMTAPPANGAGGFSEIQRGASLELGAGLTLLMDVSGIRATRGFRESVFTPSDMA
jgi:hypothetical protein